jgi:hypothetical protein
MKAEEIRVEGKFSPTRKTSERGKKSEREKKEKFRKAKARSGHIKIYEWRKKRFSFYRKKVCF